MSPSEEQAVIVFPDAAGLPDEICDEYDLATLEDQLIGANVERASSHQNRASRSPGCRTVEIRLEIPIRLPVVWGKSR